MCHAMQLEFKQRPGEILNWEAAYAAGLKIADEGHQRDIENPDGSWNWKLDNSSHQRWTRGIIVCRSVPCRCLASSSSYSILQTLFGKFVTAVRQSAGIDLQSLSFTCQTMASCWGGMRATWYMLKISSMWLTVHIMGGLLPPMMDAKVFDRLGFNVTCTGML